MQQQPVAMQVIGRLGLAMLVEVARARDDDPAIREQTVRDDRGGLWQQYVAPDRDVDTLRDEIEHPIFESEIDL